MIRIFNGYPWRFQIGDQVWVRGWNDESARIISQQITRNGWPHYRVVDEIGAKFIVPQIHISSRPIHL
jgi:hypothetical protein